LAAEVLGGSDSGGIVQSLAKGLRILGMFSVTQPSWSVSDLIRMSGYPRATTYRLVRTLESERYLVLNPASGRYQIGLAATALLHSLKEPSNLVLALHPFVQALADQLGEPVSLAIDVHGDPLVIDSDSIGLSPLTLSIGPGRVVDAGTSTAPGKLFLAYKGPEQWKAVLARPLRRRTPCTIIDPDAFTAQLERVLADGVAFDEGEHFVGLCAVAAPVWDGAGTLVAAATIQTIAERFREERRRLLVEALKSSAARMSSALGFAHHADGGGDLAEMA
jgi:DNA-binding IclR family transcriptional regulator